MKDHLVRLVTDDGSLRAAAAVTTDLVNAICRRQQTDPTATVALGRLVTGAALLGSTLKDAQRLAITVEGSGPLGRLNAETDAAGHLRASVRQPVSGLPLRDGRFDVAGAVGRAGLLHVVKDLGLREPYRGLVELYSSEIAEDLAYYLSTSEQIPSTVALGVYLEPDGRASVAGGFLIQMLPGGREDLIPMLEERLANLPPTTTLLRMGLTPAQILEQVLAGVPFTVKGKTPLLFRCTCSRPQVERMLQSLGPGEMQHLAERDEDTRVTCEFCKEEYFFSQQELASLAEALKAAKL
jgi:molecular chaperone Hsp33